MATIVVLDVAVFLHAAKLLGASPIYHDNGNVAYPIRVLISTAVQHGTFPLWDQWTHGGVPFCSLAMGLPLSPLVLVLSVIGIYGVHTFLAEIVLVHLLALLGMFKWLRTFVDTDAALLGAVCYALAAILLIQTPINFEAVVSQAMFPWYVLGMKQSLQGRSGGMALIALSLWIMFTSGYLGLNVFAVQILSLYVLVEYLLVDGCGLTRDARFRGVLYAGLGWLLFVGIINFALLESYRHFGFDFTQIRETAFDPFTGSARPDTVYTLLWPNHVSPFHEDATGGHTFPIYSGSVTCLLVLVALLHPKPMQRDGDGMRIMVLLVFAVIGFLATMSRAYGGGLFTAILLLYGKVRFHCWGLAVVVFFAITLAALGMKRLQESGGAGRVCIGGYVIFAAVMLLAQRGWPGLPAILSYPQLYLLLPMAIVMARRTRLAWPARMRVVLALTLVEVATVSTQIPALGEWPSGGINRQRMSQSAILARNDAHKTSGFPAPGNERRGFKPGNPQYFTKTPSFSGYSPNIHPKIRRLQGNPHFREAMDRIFYASDEGGRPLPDGTVAVELRRFLPNVVEARVQSQDALGMTWSSPFTPLWQLRIDGVPTAPRENAFGLTSFTVEAGQHAVELRYHPPWLALSAAVSGASILIAILLAAGAMRTPHG